jgi:hypothetical protein
MSLAEGDNSQAIADLQRRRFILALIFYGGLAAIPLGVICPCGAAAVVRQVAPDWSQSVALASFFLPLVGLAAALLVVGSRSRAKRSLALAQMSNALGLRLTLQPPRDRTDFLASFPFLSQLQVAHSGHGANLLEGTYKGRPLTAVDYTSLHLLGYKHFVKSQTVAVFRQGFETLPILAVLPQTWLDRLDQALFSAPPGESFKISGEKEFNRRFALVGEDRAAILKRMTPELIDLLLEDERTNLEVHEGMLLVYYRRTIIRGEDYAEFLKRANRIAKTLERV